MARILVCGSGYTGRLVTRELRKSGHTTVAVDQRVRGSEVVNGDLSSPFEVSDLLRKVRPECIVDCMRPFSGHRPPSAVVLDLARTAGVPFIDISADPVHLGDMYGQSDRELANASSCVVPGAGFEYVLSEAATHLAVRAGTGTPSRICVDYQLTNFWPSTGSAHTGAEALSGVSSARYEQSMKRFFQDWPGADVHVLAHHYPDAHVTVRYSLGHRGWQSIPVGLMAKSGSMGLRAQPLLDRMTAVLRGAPPRVRALCRFTVRSTVTGASGTASVECRGSDPYATTAHIVGKTTDLVTASMPGGVHTPMSILGERFVTTSETDLGLTWQTSTLERT